MNQVTRESKNHYIQDALKLVKPWLERHWLDLRIFNHLFPWGTALLALIVLILGAAAYRGCQGGEETLLQAVYHVINIASFQISPEEIAEGLNCTNFYIVLVPLLGLFFLLTTAPKFINVLRVFLVREERGQMWQMARAALIKHPIVVCGVGHVGYRIVSELHDAGQSVVGIENTPSPLVNVLVERGVPIIMGDVRNRETLEMAGVARAKAVLVCTHDDLTNIEATHHVKELNREATVVLRLFNGEIAGKIRETFDVDATLSRSSIAAEAFAQAVMGVRVQETYTVEEHTYAQARFPVPSLLEGHTLGEFSEVADVTIICLQRGGDYLSEPDPTIHLQAEDVLILFTEITHLTRVAQVTQEPALREAITIVCGLGHTGYRIVRALRRRGQRVVAIEQHPTALTERIREAGIDVRYGDFRQRSVLVEAGVAQAHALVACTEDDMSNFETGLWARDINPQLRVVMRIFEEELGKRLQAAFDIDAVYSTSAIAAPVFVNQVLHEHLEPVEGMSTQGDYILARLTVSQLSGLFGERIADLHAEEELSVLVHIHDNEIDIPPQSRLRIKTGDDLVILTTYQKFREVQRRNQSLHDSRQR